MVFWDFYYLIFALCPCLCVLIDTVSSTVPELQGEIDDIAKEKCQLAMEKVHIRTRHTHTDVCAHTHAHATRTHAHTWFHILYASQCTNTYLYPQNF